MCLADKGTLIEAWLRSLRIGVRSLLPPFLHNGSLTEEEESRAKAIARRRIIVEQKFAQIKVPGVLGLSPMCITHMDVEVQDSDHGPTLASALPGHDSRRHRVPAGFHAPHVQEGTAESDLAGSLSVCLS